MRIAYISTIKGAAWGGSEELWYQSALKAIGEKHTIGVFVYDWDEEPAPLQRLRGQGGAIFKRKRTPSFARRVLFKFSSRLGGIPDRYLNPYHRVRIFDPDRIVVTDGATYYAANDVWLRKLLYEHFAGRYIIISQGNSPYHFPDSRPLTISFFEKAKKVIFVAENNRQQAFHQLAHKLNNSLVIQNPVNLIPPGILKMPETDKGCIHFAVVGRLLVSDKGQDIVISMMAEEFWKKANIRIHIYGKGPDLDHIQALIRYYEVEDKVSFEGYSKVEDIWRRCHALLMPSICEGTPLTLLEAMISGRICIVTDVGGNAEWISDGENGFLAMAPTQELFSRKMKEAIQSVEQWPAMAERAHRDTLARLDNYPGHTLLQQIIS